MMLEFMGEVLEEIARDELRAVVEAPVRHGSRRAPHGAARGNGAPANRCAQVQARRSGARKSPARRELIAEGTRAPAHRDSVADARSVVPVFFTIDDSYAPYLGVALQSLIENASRDYRYDLVIMHHPLSKEHFEKLARLERPGFNLRFVEMDRQIEGIANRHCNKLRQDYFTLTIFFRLFIPMMFPEYDKGIYLDSDIVVPGDVSKLYEVELGDDLIGACRDFSIVDVPELVDYTNRGVGVGIENYINSGMLLMNLDALRAARLDERFLELLTSYHFENIAPDQDYLNVLCSGRITYLPEEWDAMPVTGKKPLADPHIIHYNLFAKPWCYDDIPYEEHFWRYARASEFIDEIEAHKRSYSEEQKASDAECLKELLRHGQEIAEADFNFASVFNEGKEARL